MRCASGWSVAGSPKYSVASIRLVGLGLLFDRPPEVEAAGFDDVSAIRDPVQQRLAEAGIGDHLGPLGKGQVGGQDDGGLFGSLGDDLKEELGAKLGHRHIADFVDSNQIVAFPARQDAPQLQLLFGFDELIDQIGRGQAKRTRRF